MYLALFAFFTSFVITYFSIPAIVNLALLKKLYDLPDERKTHGHRRTAVGGVAIFAGFLFAFIFYTNRHYYPQLNSILAASLILFAIGIKDDLYPLTPLKKFGGQLTAALIVTLQGDVRLESFYGLFGIGTLPYPISIALSVLAFLWLMNSFNFIDGINGLAGSLGVLSISVFGWYFYIMDEVLFVVLCLSYVGALLAFLRYNFGRARIFMGDSGSMVLGFIVAVIALFFIQKSVSFQPNIFFAISSAVFAFSVLIIPIFDTLRVVLIRTFILRKSPFSADRNHIHHALLDIGLSPLKTVSILLLTNIFFIAIALLFKDILLPKFQLLIYVLLASGLSQIPFLIRRKQKRKLPANAEIGR